MPHGKLAKRWILAMASCALVLALSPSAWGGIYKSCKCNPSLDVFQSEFFGYYPTCWRPWPGGQPTCPKYFQPQTGSDKIQRADVLPAIPRADMPGAEKLPNPSPEKKPK